MDPLYRAVELGERFTVKTASQRFPQLSMNAIKRAGIPYLDAQKPTVGNHGGKVQTFLRADVEALAAQIAGNDPVWLAVERGERFTFATAMKHFPALSHDALRKAALPYVIAQKPWIRGSHKGAKNIHTFLRADVEAFVAEYLPAYPGIEGGAQRDRTFVVEENDQTFVEAFVAEYLPGYPVIEGIEGGAQRDRAFVCDDIGESAAGHLPGDAAISYAVELGERFTVKTAIERYPQLSGFRLRTMIPHGVATVIEGQPTTTFLRADVETLVALTKRVDPIWLAVERNERFTLETAVMRFPKLSKGIIERAGLPHVIARRPNIKGHRGGVKNVQTFLLVDLADLAGTVKKRRAASDAAPPPPPRAKKRGRELEESDRASTSESLGTYFSGCFA
jgi:hypothetical protein